MVACYLYVPRRVNRLLRVMAEMVVLACPCTKTHSTMMSMLKIASPVP